MSRLQLQSKTVFTVVGLLALCASNALACIDQRSDGAASATSLSTVFQPAGSLLAGSQNSPANSPGAPTEDQSNHHWPSIVGLWIATFYNGDTNERFDTAIAQFSADGNEIENDIAVPPRAQNTCYGLWESFKDGVVRLKHIGWDFTADIFDGTVLETATVRLSRDGNSFRGRYTLDQRDLDGKLIPSLHAEGIIVGTRFKFSDSAFLPPDRSH